MNQREQIAKAMYEAPDVGDDQVHPWPPSHPNDVAWWISRADAALTVFEEAHAKDLATSPGRVKDQADSSNVAGYSKDFRVAESTPTDERPSTAELDARQAAYQQDRIDWFTDYESEPEIATNAFFRGWDAHTGHAAHATPSDHHVDHHDDEREALAQVIYLWDTAESVGANTWRELSEGQRDVWREGADAILAAGFHRTVQGEPSNVTEPGVTDISPAQMSVQGEPTPGKRLDPDFRADLVGYAKARIQDVWADVPEGVDAETLAQNVVAAQEFLWIARGFPVASAQGEPSLRDHVRNLTGASDAELDALGGFTGERSDAQCEAFVTAINASGFVLDRRAVKSGLRAAAAVQGGEHRA